MSSSFAPFSHLSQEVVDQIIDSLLDTRESEPEISHFCACALVCRSFRHRSQKHIFHLTRVFPTNSKARREDRVDSFHSILKDNPRIASYVRRLHLDMDSATEWVVDDPVFLQIMKLVTRNMAVGMQFKLSFFGGWGKFQFTNNRTFETRFVKPFVTPFIMSLDLQEMFNIPVSLFAHCPHLVELKLFYVTVEAERPPHAIDIDHSLRPQPRKFTFEDCGDTIKILAKAYVDFSHLQHLSVSGYISQESQDMNHILAASSSSLERLEFAFGTLRALKYHLNISQAYLNSQIEEFDGPLSDVYDLGRIPNLEFLSVATVTLDPADGEDPNADLCNLLRKILTGKNKMKSIVIAFKGVLEAPWSLAEYLEQLDTRSSLCGVLVNIAERGPLAVKFRLGIAVDYGEYFSDEEGEDGETFKEGEEIEKEVNEEKPIWVAKNLELMTQLSSNISLEYDYKLDFPPC